MKINIKYLVIICLFFIVYFIAIKVFNLYIPCIFHKITKLYCPGCGVTRMILSIMKGDFEQAFRYNQLLFVLSPVFLIYLGDYIYSFIKKKDSLIDRTPNTIWYVLIVILLIFGVIRNIFPYFAPTVI